jgi:hypothetical protein
MLVSLSVRKICVHPEGAVIVAGLPPLIAILASNKSPCATEAGLSIVTCVVVMSVEAWVDEAPETISARVIYAARRTADARIEAIK